MHPFLDSPSFTWIILPALIFVARICDMSLDTMRIIMIGQGRKFYAALVGFFEVCIWLMVARQVITHLPNIACFFAYAGGFAAGNYVGLWLEERIAVGVRMVRVVISQDGSALFEALKEAGYGVTSFSARGSKGPVLVIDSVVQRNEVQRVITLIEKVAPGAFFTIEDVKQVNAGVFPSDLR
jgi:uncharacterized protein YebE (UPF0316 family)